MPSNGTYEGLTSIAFIDVIIYFDPTIANFLILSANGHKIPSKVYLPSPMAHKKEEIYMIVCSSL